MSLSKLWEFAQGNREAWYAVVHGVTKIEHDLVTKQQQILGNSDTALSPFTTL